MAGEHSNIDSYVNMVMKNVCRVDGRMDNYVYMAFDLANAPPSAGSRCVTKMRSENAIANWPCPRHAKHVDVIPCCDMFYICT